MTSPKMGTRSSAPQNKADEVSANEAPISQARPCDHSSTSTEWLHSRPSAKRRHSKSPTPQPRAPPSRNRTSPRESSGPMSASQTGAVACDMKHSTADSNNQASEKKQLMDENTAMLDRVAGPRTPPNRPRVLTENGLLTSLLVLENSPLDQGVSKRHRNPPNEETIFGDWLPAHRPRVDTSSDLGPRHQHWDDSPSDRRIRKRPRDPPEEEVGFGDWLPGHRPHVNTSSDLGPRHGHQEGESVGSPNRPPQPWEL